MNDIKIVLDWLEHLDEGATIWDTDLPMIETLKSMLKELEHKRSLAATIAAWMAER